MLYPRIQQRCQIAERAVGYDHSLALAHELHVDIIPAVLVPLYESDIPEPAKPQFFPMCSAPWNIIREYKKIPLSGGSIKEQFRISFEKVRSQIPPQ